jgi:sec-independent protein translocase protein TatB
MFGMGGTEILVILIVALLFLGPDKLPEAAKQISKGIRDIKKQSRALQQTIEDDEHIGGAIRDLKSALRGELEEPVRPKPIKAKPLPEVALAALPEPGSLEHAGADAPLVAHIVPTDAAQVPVEHNILGPAEPPKLTLPPTAGERDPDDHAPNPEDLIALAQLVKPAPNTIARGAPVIPAPETSAAADSVEPAVSAAPAVPAAPDDRAAHDKPERSHG